MPNYSNWPSNSGPKRGKHPATIPKLLMYNQCKRCEYVGKGVVYRWLKTKYWYWRCPQCWAERLYPK